MHQLTLPPDRELTGLLKEAWGSDVYVLRVMVSSPFHFLAVFYHVHDNFSSCGLKLWDHYTLSVLLETCRIKWKSKRPTDRLLYFLPPGWVTLSCQRQITDNVPKHKITFCFLLHGGTAAANGFGGVNGCKIRVLFHKRSRFIDLNRCPDTAHRLSGRVSPTHPAAEIPTARYSCPSRFRGIILRL